jgi:dephospho-CoA kinase
MKVPLIVVTGPIASGKSTVARIMARKGGTYIDADELAHEALDDPEFKAALKAEFGGYVLTADGRISRLKLAGLVFPDQKKLDKLNTIIRPFVKRIARDRLLELAETSRYIVLDAVLYLQYKFSLKADLVVLTDAPEEVRVKRMMLREGFGRKEAEMRIERQRSLFEDWKRADIQLDTDRPLDEVIRDAERIRDEFLSRRDIQRRNT